jgi:hypothetical protein
MLEVYRTSHLCVSLYSVQCTPCIRGGRQKTPLTYAQLHTHPKQPSQSPHCPQTEPDNYRFGLYSDDKPFHGVRPLVREYIPFDVYTI